MSTEQTTVHAVVHTLDGKWAHVEVEQGGCGRCHEKGGCGGQHLTQMFCSGPKTYRVENTIGAGVGDRVKIAIALGSVSRSANLAYVLPLTASIGGAAMGALFGSDLSAMIGGGVGLALAFLYVIARSRSQAGNITERPHIVSRS
ncbi:MAG: SoxR reducing system RseC family protein [Azonexaceae bacterium]|nr:SoxR reducing system RseC family protein [Azonexaceae bacterium]